MRRPWPVPCCLRKGDRQSSAYGIPPGLVPPPALLQTVGGGFRRLLPFCCSDCHGQASHHTSCLAASRPARWSVACYRSIAPVTITGAAEPLRAQHRLRELAPPVSQEELGCCGQQQVACRLRQGSGQHFTAGAPAGTSLLANLLLGRQGAIIEHNLQQMQAGCQQMPLAASQQDGHSSRVLGMLITCSIVPIVSPAFLLQHVWSSTSCRWTAKGQPAPCISYCSRKLKMLITCVLFSS